MRRRTLLEDKNSENDGVFELPDGSHAAPMSVLFANKKAKRLEITNKWSTSSHPSSTFEPIGIVVIPGEHGILKAADGTNQCGVMSLVPMSCDTPEKGGTDGQNIYWGNKNTDISGKADGLGRTDSVSDGLTNYNLVNYVTTNGFIMETVQGTENTAYLPSDFFAGSPNSYDDGTFYRYDNYVNYAPSPYKNDGSYNKAYGQTTSPGSPNNALSDFKGIVNTKIITDLATAQTDWRTASTITDSSSAGYYPAACCCARFKTTGTKAFVDCTTEELRNGSGFWYMPAMGELGYVMVRIEAINDTINSLKKDYNVNAYFKIANYFWSSTEYDKDNARFLYAFQGTVDYYGGKNYGNNVHAFLRV